MNRIYGSQQAAQQSSSRPKCDTSMATPIALILVLAARPSAWSKLWSDEHGRAFFWDASRAVASWSLPNGESLSPPAAPPPAALQGWSDCTADAAALYSGGGLQRAWRRRALSLHPDKAGSAGGFQAATEARDYLRSPSRYFAYRALHAERPPLRKFGESAQHELSTVLTARASMRMDTEGWPRLTLEASLRPPGEVDLGRTHVWRIALAAENASTIEYKGDSGAGGYDVCCGFVRGSRCELRGRDEVVELLTQQAENGTTSFQSPTASVALVSTGGQQPQPVERAWHQLRDVHYRAHDCPLRWSARGGLTLTPNPNPNP